MFKVGDRVVAIGGSYVGKPNESMAMQIKNKTVLTVTEVRDYRTAGFSIICKDMISSELQGFDSGSGWAWHQSELRYATKEEIAEADKKEECPHIKQIQEWINLAKEGKMLFSNYPIRNYGVGLSHLIGDGMSFTSMCHPKDKDMPEDFNITTEYDTDCEVDVSNDCEHVELDAGECADTVYLEPQEARATAKALCEHADYVDKMKEKAKPKQPVFKIWKEGVKDEVGVVWLRLVRDAEVRVPGITLRAVRCDGSHHIWGGNILIIKDDGTLYRCQDCDVPGIQIDLNEPRSRIKEAE